MSERLGAAAGARRRADAGLVRVTERDVELLGWVGEQFAVSVPQLARLMGRSEHAARWLRARWQSAGWAAGGAVVVGEPVFVWLTGAGARLCGSPFKVWDPNPGMLRHVGAVNEARLYVAERRPEARWVSERELAREQGPGRPAHRPDAVVVVGERRVAVEVELTQKSVRRLEAIVAGLLGEFDAVWYFAAPGARAAVERVATRVPDGRLHVAAVPGPRG